MKLALALVALGAFLAGAAAMLTLVDRLLGGHGVTVELRPAHRRALDGGGWAA